MLKQAALADKKKGRYNSNEQNTQYLENLNQSF